MIHDILVLHGDQEAGSPKYRKYDFTDLSTSFFEKAQETFKGWNRMRFATLDIEQDPIGQGFIENSYDLIIAAYVRGRIISGVDKADWG